MKINWRPGDTAARTFRDSNIPGIVFRYKAGFSTEAEAQRVAMKLKDQGKHYCIQGRDPGTTPNCRAKVVYVVFEGKPKGSR